MLKGLADDIRLQLRSGGLLTWLISINVAVYLALNLLLRLGLILAGYSRLEVDMLFEKVHYWLAFPYDLTQLAWKPWTLISSMFLHSGFSHIFWNMVLLYWFGKILNEFSRKKLGPVYFAGGIFATFFSLASVYLVPYFYPIPPLYGLGASGAVTAVMIAAAALVPNYSMNLLFIGPVKLKYIALSVFILDLISVTYFSNAGGHFAHIGGALFGLSFILLLKKGFDLSSLFRFKWKKRASMKVIRNRASGERLSKAEIRRRIDDILDKINKSGYDSLTKEEKEDWFRLHDKV